MDTPSIPPEPQEQRPISTKPLTLAHVAALLDGDTLTPDERRWLQKRLTAMVRGRIKGRRYVRPRMARADDTSTKVLDTDRHFDAFYEGAGVFDMARWRDQAPADDSEIEHRIHLRGLRRRFIRERRLLRSHARLLSMHPRLRADLRHARHEALAELEATWAPSLAAAKEQSPRLFAEQGPSHAELSMRHQYEQARDARIGPAAVRLLQNPRYEGVWQRLRDYYRVPPPLIERAVQAALRGTWDDAITVLVGAVEVMHVDKEHGEYYDRLQAQGIREPKRAAKEIAAAMPGVAPNNRPHDDRGQMAVYRVWWPWHQRNPDGTDDMFALLVKQLGSAESMPEGRQARDELGAQAITILQMGWPMLFATRTGKEGKPRGVDQSTIRKKLVEARAWLDREEQARYEGTLAAFEQRRRQIEQQEQAAKAQRDGWLDRAKAKTAAYRAAKPQ